jgi:hypothetical protein
MNDNNLYKIALGLGMSLFLNIKSFLVSHIVQYTVPKRKNNTLLYLPPLKQALISELLHILHRPWKFFLVQSFNYTPNKSRQGASKDKVINRFLI